jgi:hypothetical protein
MASQIPVDLNQLIGNLVENIEMVQSQLSHPASDPATGLALRRASITQVQRLKISVDQFRLFLWAYVDSWSHGAITPEARLQRIRMEAATDMLRNLTKDFANTGVPPSSEAARLGEQLRAIASVMIDVRGRKES